VVLRCLLEREGGEREKRSVSPFTHFSRKKRRGGQLSRGRRSIPSAGKKKKDVLSHPLLGRERTEGVLRDVRRKVRKCFHPRKKKRGMRA